MTAPSRTLAGLRAYRERNRERINAWHRDKWANDPTFRAKARDKSFRSKYGITLEDFEGILVAQNYKCLLCSVVLERKGKHRVVVDHCHDTGRVRGLLCNLCNVSLGCLGDNEAGLKRALAYVQQSELTETVEEHW